MTEIHDAVKEGNIQVLTKKLKSSNINGKDPQGQTPLHIAASEGKTEIVKLLLKKKADVNEVDPAGWTPLHCASAILSREPTTMLEVCDALLDEPETDAATQTVDGGTALHYLVRFPPPSNLKDAYMAVLRKVLVRGGSVLHCNKDGEFPIHIAAMRSNVDAVQFLLENGAKANILTNKRENSLHYAMMPENSSVELVQLLLNQGGDRFIVSDKEDSPFTLAKKLKRSAIVDMLQDAKPPPLVSVVRNNKIQTIATQLKFGQDVNQKDRNGMTPLFHALTTFHNGVPSMEMIGILLDSGKIDFMMTDNQGNTALHYALKTAKLEVDQLIKNMIGKGAHKIIDWENNLGETPLHVACLYRNVKAVKTLLAAAANPLAANQKEETILHYAVLGRSPEIVNMILEFKPNVDLQTPLLGSAVELAVLIKDPQIAELLLKNSSSKKSLSDFKEEQVKRNKEEKKREKEKEEREKKEKEKEEKERKEKEKEDKDRKKRESKRATLRKDASQDSDINISLPSQVKKLVHVSTDWEWSGSEDPADIFNLEKKVGEGAYGAVYRSIHKASGFIVAIKLVRCSNAQGTDIEKEIEILKKCRDPNIVSYFGCCVKDQNLWILMEFCGCGSVLDLVKKLNADAKKVSPEQLAAILTFVLKGLNYLHARGTIHRDLKPANILLTAAGECKLADFGVSATLSKTEEQKAQTSIGTPVYMSPEAIQGEQYDFKTDIWSLGITAIEIAQGTLPFDGNLPRVVGLILSGPPIGLKDPAQHSKEFNEFVTQCLFREPIKRKKASELLAHPFTVKYITNDHRKVIKDLLSQYYHLDQAQSQQAPQERERSAASPPESPKGTMEPSRDPPSLENNNTPTPKRQSLGTSRSSNNSANNLSIILPPKNNQQTEVTTMPPKEEELELLEDPNLIQAQLALTSTMLDPRLMETLRETVLDLRVQLSEEKRNHPSPQSWQPASANNANSANPNNFLAIEKLVTQQEQMIEALNKLLDEQKKEIELLKLKLVQANQEKNQLASKVEIWKRECSALRQSAQKNLFNKNKKEEKSSLNFEKKPDFDLSTIKKEVEAKETIKSAPLPTTSTTAKPSAMSIQEMISARQKEKEADEKREEERHRQQAQRELEIKKEKERQAQQEKERIEKLQKEESRYKWDQGVEESEEEPPKPPPKEQSKPQPHPTNYMASSINNLPEPDEDDSQGSDQGEILPISQPAAKQSAAIKPAAKMNNLSWNSDEEEPVTPKAKLVTPVEKPESKPVPTTSAINPSSKPFSWDSDEEEPLPKSSLGPATKPTESAPKTDNYNWDSEEEELASDKQQLKEQKSDYNWDSSGSEKKTKPTTKAQSNKSEPPKLPPKGSKLESKSNEFWDSEGSDDEYKKLKKKIASKSKSFITTSNIEKKTPAKQEVTKQELTTPTPRANQKSNKSKNDSESDWDDEEPEEDEDDLYYKQLEEEKKKAQERVKQEQEKIKREAEEKKKQQLKEEEEMKCKEQEAKKREEEEIKKKQEEEKRQRFEKLEQERKKKEDNAKREAQEQNKQLQDYKKKLAEEEKRKAEAEEQLRKEQEEKKLQEQKRKQEHEQVIKTWEEQKKQWEEETTKLQQQIQSIQAEAKKRELELKNSHQAEMQTRDKESETKQTEYEQLKKSMEEERHKEELMWQQKELEAKKQWDDMKKQWETEKYELLEQERINLETERQALEVKFKEEEERKLKIQEQKYNDAISLLKAQQADELVMAKQREDRLQQEVQRRHQRVDKLMSEMNLLQQQLDEKEVIVEQSEDVKAQTRSHLERKNLLLVKEIERKQDEIDKTIKVNMELLEQNLGYRNQISLLEDKVRNAEEKLLKKMEEHQARMKENKHGTVKENSEVRILSVEMDALKEELKDMHAKREEREQKISFLQDEIKKMRQKTLLLEHENDSLKQQLEDMEQEHAIQLRKIIGSQLEQTKEATDIKTLKITINLLNEQLMKLKEENKEANEKIAQTKEDKDRIATLEKKIVEEMSAKSELGRALEVRDMKLQNNEKLIEFLRSQLDEWKSVHNEEKMHWRKEIDLAVESYRSRIFELERERDQLVKHLERDYQSRSVVQAFIEKEVHQHITAKHSRSVPPSAVNNSQVDEGEPGSVTTPKVVWQAPEATESSDVLDIIRSNQKRRETLFNSSHSSDNLSKSVYGSSQLSLSLLH